tara:strand:+ start:4799 stop:5224 length:426 start_codon:yes stop_codon:yes gene_type:complete
MVAYSGQSPVNAKDIQNTFASQGLLVKYNAAGIMITASVTDKPIGVTIDESSRDAAGTLEAAGTGTVSILPLTGVQYIKCVGGGVLKTGEALYVSQTAEADGHVHTTSSNSATFVGYYFGEDGITPAAGDLIPVFCRGAHI